MSKKISIVVTKSNYSVVFDQSRWQTISIDEADIESVLEHLHQRIHSFQYNYGPVKNGYIILPETMYKILEAYCNYFEQARLFGLTMSSFRGYKIIMGDTLQAIIGWEK